MAKRSPAPKPQAVELSELARHLLAFHGIARLKMIRSEHQAGLPHDMPQPFREQRINAIDEILSELK